MDAISSLKTYSAGLPGGFPNPAQDAAFTRPIPSPELDKLNPPITLPPLDQSQPVYSFENVVGGLVNEVSQKQAAANDAVTGLLSGQNVSLHQAMISMEEANVSFQLMTEVRNRLLDSYQELMRMQI